MLKHFKKASCKDFDVFSVDTIGDGSCFLHSVLFCFSKKYRKIDVKSKIKMVRELRHDLSNVLSEKNEETGKTYYQELSRGEIEELSKEIPEMKLIFMKKYLASNHWLNIFFLEFISNQLNIDIYILNSKDGSIYKTGDDEIYFKGRNSVIIKYIEEAHFESCGVAYDNKLETFFDPDCFIVRQLRGKLSKGKKV